MNGTSLSSPASRVRYAFDKVQASLLFGPSWTLSCQVQPALHHSSCPRLESHTAVIQLKMPDQVVGWNPAANTSFESTEACMALACSWLSCLSSHLAHFTSFHMISAQGPRIFALRIPPPQSEPEKSAAQAVLADPLSCLARLWRNQLGPLAFCSHELKRYPNSINIK